MGEGGTKIRYLAVGAACAVFVSLFAPPAGGAPGVSKRRIKIGLHGPVTGAVPLPNDSAAQAARVFWRWLRLKDRTINGRHVRVVLRNDQTNPSQAVAVCKEMVERERVFALASLPAGFPYQAEACARYAESVGVPYISMGVGRRLLRNFERYFSVSKPYPGQARLLADYFTEGLHARREANGIVYPSATSWQEPIRAFKRAMARRNAEIAYERQVPNNAGTSEARLLVEEMRLAGVENAFFIHRPMFFTNVLKQAGTQSYTPQWTGIDNGIAYSDSVVDVGCEGGSSVDGARFLTPVPAYRDRDDFDPRHDRAMRRVYDSRGNVTTWLGWALSKALRRMLDEPGRRLTRSRLERTVERSGFRTGILPRVRFRPDNHFGGRGMHLLRADCTDSRWHTARRFVNDF